MPNSDVEHAETIAKKRRACELRIYQSVSYQKIADEFGVSVSTVRNWIREATVTMLPKEEADELRQHELAKIDASEHQSLQAMALLGQSAEQRAQEGKPIDDELECLRRWQETLKGLRHQRAQLLGLNVPVTVNHRIKIRTEFDAEVEALVSDLLGGGTLFTTPDEVDNDAVSTGE